VAFEENMRWPNNYLSKKSVLVCSILLVAGCTTVKTTTTARTATEQLLISTAADHALQRTGLDMFDSRKVYLDATYFDSYDSKYVLGTIRDAISRAGAILENTASNSDIVIEARSGALAIDQSDTMFGIPSFGIPVPLAGTLQTPEVAFYKSERQRSTAKFALLAVARDTGAHVYSTGPLDGSSFDKHSRIFFIAWRRTDVPERRTTKQGTNEYQTWFPQYDPANLPATNMPAK
jgi:hypothetical protein